MSQENAVEQPDVRRPRGEESDDHPDLHEEPVSHVGGIAQGYGRISLKPFASAWRGQERSTRLRAGP
jgi:hypothetical protein